MCAMPSMSSSQGVVDFIDDDALEKLLRRPLPDRSLDMAKALDMICQAVLLAREVMGGDHPEAKPCISNLKGMCFAAVDSELLEESHSSVLAAKKLVEVA